MNKLSIDMTQHITCFFFLFFFADNNSDWILSSVYVNLKQMQTFFTTNILKYWAILVKS